MRELPILFKGEMVRAILDGSKTQTRRVVKPQGIEAGVWPDGAFWVRREPGTEVATLRCPYGAPGELLYVRETWRPWSWHEGEPMTIEFQADGLKREITGRTMEEDVRIPEWEESQGIALSKELGAKGVEVDEDGTYCWEGESPLKWHPSIHLPKFGSRIWLRVTDVRVERVQEISEADARAEGIDPDAIIYREGDDAHNQRRTEIYERYGTPCGDQKCADDCDTFAYLWDSINAKRAPWESNPWVWAVTFERTETP